jgi:hypothetical protein
VMKVNTIQIESSGLDLWVTGVITGSTIMIFVGVSLTLVLIQRKRTKR